MKIRILQGPNLNLLGQREPEHYGAVTLEQIDRQLVALGQEHGAQVECFQSNAEHELIGAVQQAPINGVEFIIINPAAFTHTSVALRDALAAIGVPFIEVHLSNVHAREPFRAHSHFSGIALGVICGLGAHGYELALLAALRRLSAASGG